MPHETRSIDQHACFLINSHSPLLFESDSNDYRDEAVRLDSFQRWPHSANLRPEELARAGFYFLDRDDRVQCAFCKGVLGSWEKDDSAQEEHRKHFPTCPFICDSEAAGNRPIKKNCLGVHLRQGVNNFQDEDLGILRERPHHPTMTKMVERVNSFSDSFITESTQSLEFAEAGFFFTGHGGSVKCFFCDGGLQNWERNDDPMVKHARWYPKCGYLLSKKGDEYVK